MSAAIRVPSALEAVAPAAVLISVVLSTFNRAQDLGRLFGSLRDQTLNGKRPWELVIVDNRSSDDTAQVIDDLARPCGFPVVHVFEARPGKSHGLNTGLSVARGALIAFTDDDCVPAPDWLERIARRFDAQHDLVCLGGRVELYDPADASITVRLSRERSVIDATSFSASNIPIIGCNMAIQAAALRAVGPFDADVGPGSGVGVCDDVDMLYRLIAAGHSLHYDPELLVRHNHGRRAPAQIERVVEGYAIGRGVFYCKYLLKADRNVLKWAYWEMRATLSAILRDGFANASTRSPRQHLRHLLVGAGRYLWRRGRRAIGVDASSKAQAS